MDKFITNAEANAVWQQGYKAAEFSNQTNPYDYDGDGNRAAEWDAGFNEACNRNSK